MGTLRYPAPEMRQSEHGLTVHTWSHPQPRAEPVLLVHGFASNTLFNWVKTGWLDPLTSLGRTIIAVDLPGHGASEHINPSGLRVADILDDLRQVVQQAGGTVALHGYSLGARLSWEFAAHHSDLVSSLVVGGPPVSDNVYQVDAEQARTWAVTGAEPTDENTREFITVASALPGQNLPHVVELRLTLAQDPYDPRAAVPRVPTLVVAGSKDRIAAGSADLAALVTAAGAPASDLQITGRNHVNALTAQEYKRAVVEFLGG